MAFFGDLAGGILDFGENAIGIATGGVSAAASGLDMLNQFFTGIKNTMNYVARAPLQIGAGLLGALLIIKG